MTATAESFRPQDLSSEEKSQLVMTAEIGARMVPVVGEPVPTDCDEGFGTWSPIKQECVLCQFVAICFCRSTDTPPRVVALSRKPPKSRRKDSNSMSTMQAEATPKAPKAPRGPKSGLPEGLQNEVEKIGDTLREQMKGDEGKVLLTARQDAKTQHGFEGRGKARSFEDHTKDEHLALRTFHIQQSQKHPDGSKEKNAHVTLANAHTQAVGIHDKNK